MVDTKQSLGTIDIRCTFCTKDMGVIVIESTQSKWENDSDKIIDFLIKNNARPCCASCREKVSIRLDNIER